MHKYNVFTESDIQIPFLSTTRSSEGATHAFIQASDNIRTDIARITKTRDSLRTSHLPIFLYSPDTTISANDKLEYYAAGVLEIFDFSSLESTIDLYLKRTPTTPLGSPYRLEVSGIVSPRILIYDDKLDSICRVNNVVYGKIKCSGRPDLKDFYVQAREQIADLYVVDLIDNTDLVGIDIIRELTSEIKVKGAIVAYSKYLDPKIKNQCLEAGAHGYITKSRDDRYLGLKLTQYTAIGRFLKESST